MTDEQTPAEKPAHHPELGVSAGDVEHYRKQVEGKSLDEVAAEADQAEPSEWQVEQIQQHPDTTPMPQATEGILAPLRERVRQAVVQQANGEHVYLDVFISLMQDQSGQVMPTAFVVLGIKGAVLGQVPHTMAPLSSAFPPDHEVGMIVGNVLARLQEAKRAELAQHNGGAPLQGLEGLQRLQGGPQG